MILYNVKAEKLIKFLQSCNMKFIFIFFEKERKIVEKELKKQERKKENNTRNF